MTTAKKTTTKSAPKDAAAATEQLVNEGVKNATKAFEKMAEMSKAQFEAFTGQAGSLPGLGELGEANKANMDALMASQKALVKNLEAMSADSAATLKKAFEGSFETLKSFTEVKDPSSFGELQASVIKQGFEFWMDAASKGYAAADKASKEVFAPIQARMTEAGEVVAKGFKF